MKSFQERAKDKAEKSKHYSTARNHAVSAAGYFGLFLATVVVDHVVEAAQARREKTDESSSEAKDRPSLFDRFLAGM